MKLATWFKMIKSMILAGQLRGTHQLFHHQARGALVVPRDQSVGLVHGGRVDGEPVQDPDRIFFRIVEVQLHHLRVHIGGISGIIFPDSTTTTKVYLARSSSGFAL